ncbi:MAG: DUF262 domain-containing protein [Bacteroidota bacterium]|nr:DUF262 domain-containing protein [Bacteroidota bacterium]
MSESTIKTIREYFEGNHTFVIPNYQRGYKWGVPSKRENNEEGEEAVGVLMESLLNAFSQDLNEYFLQGITVVEKGDKTILIDGQQRTTTLFILLSYLNKETGGLESLIKRNDDIVISYDIREESHKYLKILSSPEYCIETPDRNSDRQDIFYFKKAINTIQTRWNNFFQDVQKNPLKLKCKEYTPDSYFNSEKLLSIFTEYLLDHVKMLYIPINQDNATTIFQMMNGQKAEMKVEELIKSAILSQSSREKIESNEVKGNDIDSLLKQIKDKIGEEWEINLLRSKYAREWDKWLYWWNDKEVSNYFGTHGEPMGLLLEYFYYWKSSAQNYSQEKKRVRETFNAFKKEFLKDTKEAKNNFLEIRKLQKTFEDWYNTPEYYNCLGLILKCCSEKRKALVDLIVMALGNKGNKALDNKEMLTKFQFYAKYMLIDAAYEDIKSEKKDKLSEKAIKVKGLLNEPDVYNDQDKDGKNCKIHVFRQLLRINIEIESKFNRKFDFNIWSAKSLEHVHPKSKVYKKIDGKFLRCTDDKEIKPDDTYLNRTDFLDECTEHCIGNLFLLYGNDNSEFGAKDFKVKKELLFQGLSSGEKKNILESMKLIHTISAFAETEWSVKTIRDKKAEFIQAFSETYSLDKN